MAEGLTDRRRGIVLLRRLHAVDRAPAANAALIASRSVLIGKHDRTQAGMDRGRSPDAVELVGRHHVDTRHEQIGAVVFDQRDGIVSVGRLADHLDANPLDQHAHCIQPERMPVQNDSGPVLFPSPKGPPFHPSSKCRYLNRQLVGSL